MNKLLARVKVKVKTDLLKEIIETYKALPEDKLETAISASKQSGTPLMQVLINKKFLTEKDTYKLLSQYFKIPFADLEDIQVPKEALAKLPEMRQDLKALERRVAEWMLRDGSNGRNDE